MSLKFQIFKEENSIFIQNESSRIDSMNMGKVANLESMVSGDCTISFGHITMRTSGFDTDFASQMKFKLPLIYTRVVFKLG